MFDPPKTAARLIALAAAFAFLLWGMALRAHAALDLTVRAQDGTEYAFDMEPTDRVEQLREKVSQSAGLELGSVRLLFQGKELQDGNTLQDYSIQKGSVILLVQPVSADRAVVSGTAALTDTQPVTGGQGVCYEPTAWVTFGTDESGAPIRWRVLDSGIDVNGTTGIFLLTEQLQAEDVVFNTDWTVAAAWEGSLAQSWCQDFAAGRLSSAESAAVLPTSREEEASELFGEPYAACSMQDEKVFFLSVQELAAYVADYDGAPELNLGKEWWLRTPMRNIYDMPSSSPGLVFVDGRVGAGSCYTGRGARPALNLEAAKVLFTSAAAGGKGSGAVSGQLEAVAEYTGSDWKLTLLDGSRSFTATAQLSGAVAPGAQVAVSYSGAGAGGQEYVSAAILDSSGNWLYYGAIAQNSASGTASVTVPEDLAAGSYTLRVFSEQRRGDGLTDLASGFSDFELTVVHVHHARKVEAVAPTTTAEGNREYWYCDGCGGCFADEACTVPLTREEIILPKLPSGGDGGQSSGGQGGGTAAATPTPAPAQPTPTPSKAPVKTAVPEASAVPEATASPSTQPDPTATPAPTAEPSASPAPGAEAAGGQAQGGLPWPVFLALPVAAAGAGFGLWYAVKKRRG